MKRKKFSTLIDEDLYRQTKVEAARRGVPITDVVCEALSAYVGSSEGRITAEGAVADSWGALRLPKEQVQALLEEEDDFLGS